jgi:hypothetical protein
MDVAGAHRFRAVKPARSADHVCAVLRRFFGGTRIAVLPASRSEIEAVEEPVRLRFQIRAVLVVYRAEMARLSRSSRSDQRLSEDLGDLRTRCLLILDTARAGLDGQAAWHPDLLDELARARAEVTGNAGSGPRTA